MKSNERRVADIFLAAIIGTTCMTLFSFAVSEKKKRNFKEPQLLGKMIHRAIPEANKNTSQGAGWLLHYGTGLFFTTVYDRFLRLTKSNPTVLKGLVAGGVTGLIGILIWKTTFKLHPNSPKIKFRRYYGHLLATHLIFGTTTFLTMKNKP